MDITAIVGITAGFLITVTAILTDSITKYKLKVEQIRADAMVRAEEVRARNQLELDRLMNQERGNISSNSPKKTDVQYDMNEGRDTRPSLRE